MRMPRSAAGRISDGVRGSIDGRVAGGAGLPAAVHPEPLGGVLADGVFEDSVEARGVFDGVGLGVAGGDEGDLGVEVQDVLLFGVLPEQEAGDDGGAGAE